MKKVLAGTLVVASLFGGTTSAFAAEYPAADKAITDSVIEFEIDDEITQPVDPTDPTDPIEPVDPTNPTGAELMITYASSLDFGVQSKSGTSWNAQGDELKTAEGEDAKYITPLVSIKDSRGTERQGWVLQAQLDDEFKAGDAVLDGAEISYSNMNTADLNGAPIVAGDTALSIGEATDIATADAKQGVGSWSVGLGELDKETNTTDGVTLTVPLSSAKNTAKYKTTITYTLVADPAS